MDGRGLKVYYTLKKAFIYNTRLTSDLCNHINIKLEQTIKSAL